MNNVPAHKQTDPDKAPGQIKTLDEYIQVKKVQIKEEVINTPDEFTVWWMGTKYPPVMREYCRLAWDAAKGVKK